MTPPPSGPAGRYFVPGPVEVRPEVLAALAGSMMPVHGDRMRDLYARLDAPLRRLFRTQRPVLLAASSSTGFMEAAIRCGVRERVLVVVGGFFGDRFARVAEACGKDVVRVTVPEGRTVEPDHLARFFDGPPIDAVALVHSETSTGAAAPLADLARVVQAQDDVLLLVDAVTSIGGMPVETDAWGLDFVFAGTQKALAVPPGLAMAVASERLLERARRLAARGWYFDLLLHEDAVSTGMPTQTPALPQLYGLAYQLDRIDESGGVEARWRRHYRMLQVLERWALDQPAVSLLAPEGRRSWTVSALTVPPASSSHALAADLLDRGWVVAVGLGSLTDRVIRIGHMGDVTADDLEGLLEELGAVLRARGKGSQASILRS